MRVFSFFQGFLTGAGLIVGIGPQNAFVLKQGIAKNRILLTALFCSLADAFLIVIGTYGVGAALSASEAMMLYSRWGGALFLFAYAIGCFYKAYKGHFVKVKTDKGSSSLKKTLWLLFALSFLNPYVYFDTIVLLGTIGSNLDGTERPLFTAGAILSSFLWFFSLSFGSSFLAPLFKNPKARRFMELAIGLIMCLIATALLLGKI
jgi:L-lysine exporter family protein LysE/ArgO